MVFKAYDILEFVMDAHLWELGKSYAVVPEVLAKVHEACDLMDELSKEVEGGGFQAEVTEYNGMRVMLECPAPPVEIESKTLVEILERCSRFSVEQDGDGLWEKLVFSFDGLWKEVDG